MCVPLGEGGDLRWLIARVRLGPAHRTHESDLHDSPLVLHSERDVPQDCGAVRASVCVRARCVACWCVRVTARARAHAAQFSHSAASRPGGRLGLGQTRAARERVSHDECAQVLDHNVSKRFRRDADSGRTCARARARACTCACACLCVSCARRSQRLMTQTRALVRSQVKLFVNKFLTEPQHAKIAGQLSQQIDSIIDGASRERRARARAREGALRSRPLASSHRRRTRAVHSHAGRTATRTHAVL